LYGVGEGNEPKRRVAIFRKSLRLNLILPRQGAGPCALAKPKWSAPPG
jgi:hypothetical protein